MYNGLELDNWLYSQIEARGFLHTGRDHSTTSPSNRLTNPITEIKVEEISIMDTEVPVAGLVALSGNLDCPVCTC